MRVPSHHTSGPAFDLTPMIDIVFLLIIFFVVSSQVTKQESLRELNLHASETVGREDLRRDEIAVIVNIEPDGRMTVAGRTTRQENLLSRLRGALDEHGPDVKIVIRCDRQAAYREVEPVLLACAEAGIWNVTFAVYRAEAER